MTKRARIPAIALPLLALGVAVSGCDLVPRKVTESDCRRWNEHNAEVLKHEFGEAIKKCEPSLVEAMTKEMADGVDRGMRDDVDNCSKQASQGARVIPKEVDCFLAGKTLADWKACNFTMPTFKTETLQGELSKIDEFCTKGAGRKGGPATSPK
jgi:hypothetical protein